MKNKEKIAEVIDEVGTLTAAIALAIDCAQVTALSQLMALLWFVGKIVNNSDDPKGLTELTMKTIQSVPPDVKGTIQ